MAAAKSGEVPTRSAGGTRTERRRFPFFSGFRVDLRSPFPTPSPPSDDSCCPQSSIPSFRTALRRWRSARGCSGLRAPPPRDAAPRCEERCEGAGAAAAGSRDSTAQQRERHRQAQPLPAETEPSEKAKQQPNPSEPTPNPVSHEEPGRQLLPEGRSPRGAVRRQPPSGRHLPASRRPVTPGRPRGLPSASAVPPAGGPPPERQRGAGPPSLSPFARRRPRGASRRGAARYLELGGAVPARLFQWQRTCRPPRPISARLGPLPRSFSERIRRRSESYLRAPGPAALRAAPHMRGGGGWGRTCAALRCPGGGAGPGGHGKQNYL